MILSALPNPDLQTKPIHLQEGNVKLRSHYFPQEINLLPKPLDFHSVIY